MDEPQEGQLWAVREDVAPYGGGFVKLYKSMLDHRYMAHSEIVHFYIWCIMKAAFKPYKQMVGMCTVSLERGQFVFGRLAASQETGISVQKIRTIMQLLQKDEKLTIKSTNKFSIITVVNFDRWQSSDDEVNQQINQQLTSKQPATNHKKEYKRNKNTCVFLFEKFWQMYPRKVGKASALKIWERISPSDDLAAKMFKSVELQKQSEQWKKNNGQFIPHPSTWLNQGRWDDVVEVEDESWKII